MTAGVELLAHIREAFGDEAHLATVTLLERLRERDESPWKDIYGKPLDDRGLAKRLKPYGIKSKTVRAEGKTPKGYSAEDFNQSWRSYLPASASDVRHKGNNRHIIDNKNNLVADVADREAPKAGVNGNGQVGDEPHHKSVYFKFFRDVGLGQVHDFSSHAADALGLMAVSYIEPATSRAFHRPIKYPNLGWPNGADCYPTEPLGKMQGRLRLSMLPKEGPQVGSGCLFPQIARPRP
jgi:hypothetical protein